MAQILSISTKKGDAGFSYLADGTKHAKTDFVFAVLGTLDEFNSHIGVAVAHLHAAAAQPDTDLHPNRSEKTYTIADVVAWLETIQESVYVLSGLVARAPRVAFDPTTLSTIEALGDELQTLMADGWTTQFIYPGGSLAAAQLDVARSVCRRGERQLLLYSKKYPLPEIILQYVNRLSDFLFILRCFVNAEFGVFEKKFSYKKSQKK